MKKQFLTLFSIFFLTIVQTSAQTAMGGWYFSSSVDPLTDAKESHISLPSTEYEASFVIRCNDKLPREVYVVTDTFLNLQGTVNVTFRFDKKPLITGRWDVSTDNKAVFIPYSLQLAFLKKAAGAKSFIIRITKYNDENLTYQFDWTGFKTAYAKLPCKKKL